MKHLLEYILFMSDQCHSSKPEKVLIRIRVSASNKSLRASWINKLQSHGCKIHAAGHFAIEAYMDQSAIRLLLGKKVICRDGEKFLEVDMSLLDNNHSQVSNFGKESATAKSKYIPDAYIPSKKELF